LKIELVQVMPTGSLAYQWPEGEPEQYSRWWDILAEVDGRQVRLRHATGLRPAYGRERVRSVTWLAGSPTVEGVEADDYAESGALLSLLRHPDKRHIRDRAELPAGYEGFRVVSHRTEIAAPYSLYSLAFCSSS
jgi:hypothetical protein